MGFRAAAIEHLRLLADFEAQRAYERNVPIANVPAELVCAWFDDVYQPEIDGFVEQFTPDELAVLRDFTSRFDQVVDALGDSRMTVEHLQGEKSWQELSGLAAATVSRLTSGKP